MAVGKQGFNPAKQPAQSLAPPRASGDSLLAVYADSGRPEDFEAVVRYYAALVFAECRRVTRDAHDAEDAAQLSFLALAIEVKGGASIRSPGAWLVRVAHRQSLKIVRSRGRRKRREDAAAKPDRQPDAAVLVEPGDQAAVTSAVREAIDALPERYRLPLVLHYFGGMTLDAIARELRIKRPAVGVRLHRGRKMLGERLHGRGLAFGDDGALAAIIATLVPAAVLSSLIRSSSAASHPAALLASNVTAMLQASTGILTMRPIAAAAIVIGLAASSFAWFKPNRLVELLPIHFDVRHWIDRVFSTPVPRLTASAVSTVQQTSPPVQAMAGPYFTPSRENIDYFQSMSAPAFATATKEVLSTPAAIDLAARDDAAAQPFDAGAIAINPPGIELARVGSPPEQKSTLPGAAFPMHFNASKAQLTADVSSVQRASLNISAGNYHSTTITLGVRGDERGEIVQTGGIVSTNSLVVGRAGVGRYDVLGGQLNVGGISIGEQPHSHGELRIAGGEVHLSDPGRPIQVGVRGVGKLLLGSRDSPGLVTTATDADVPLIVRATASAHGVVEGWGEVRAHGSLTNNGRVIADGFDHLRDLDLGQFSSVNNTIDNPRDGSNGWFVKHGGRLTLPSIPVHAGTQSYNWGESASDQTPDLVNSLRLTVHNQPTAGSLSISLRTIALADPLDLALPAGVAVTGLWQFDTRSFAPTSLDFVVRYDPSSASMFFPGESALQLIGAGSDGVWHIASGNSIDFAQRWVSGSFDGSLRYLAVGLDLAYPFATPQFRVPQAFHTISASSIVVPEPSTLSALLGVAFSLRRKRQRK